MRSSLLVTIPTALLGFGCGGTTTEDSPGPTGESLISTTLDQDIYTTTIVATDPMEWVFLSMESSGVEVTIQSPKTSMAWDLGFRRSNARLNGGASGSGMGATVPLVDVTLESVSRAPLNGWITDEAAEQDGNNPSPVVTDGVDFALTRAAGQYDNGWFIYDPTTHTLSTAPIVWAVRGPTDKYYAVEVFDWYGPAGTSGIWTLRWKPIDPPEGAPRPGFVVDASTRGVATYVRLDDGSVVSPSDPRRSSDWDLALARTQILTNSGVSGSGHGGARLAPPGSTYGSLSSSPTSGFAVDELIPVPGPSGGDAAANPVLSQWFDYNETTHMVTPKNEVFIVRTAEGRYRKLQVLEWTGGVFRLNSSLISVRPDVFQLEVDARDAATPVFVSLRLASVVQSSTASTDWDVMLTRTTIQTNSGVSGVGSGGAQVLAGATSLDDLTMAPAEGYSVDRVMESGRPGAPPAPANPVLSAWYDYDVSTHTVSPKSEVYAVRTADGHFAALQIMDYRDGRYSLQGIFAGAGRSSFQ